MQAIFVPKYKIYYRVSPKEPNVLQWSNKPFGPATQWQTAMRFGKPIRALDTDDKTGQGVVVLNDSSTYVGSGVRVWGRKFYPAGTRIYSLYAIGESKMTNKLKIKIHENKKHRSVTYTINRTTSGNTHTIIFDNTTVWDVFQQIIAQSKENPTFDGAIQDDDDIYINRDREPWSGLDTLSKIHSVSDFDEIDDSFASNAGIETMDDINYIVIGCNNGVIEGH